MSNNILAETRARAAAASAVLTTDSNAEKAPASSKEPEFPVPGASGSVSDKPAEEKAEVLKHEPYVPVEGDYKALRLRQFYTETGKRIAPNFDGWYHPEDEEQKGMLEYYATKHGLVEAFQPTAE